MLFYITGDGIDMELSKKNKIIEIVRKCYPSVTAVYLFGSYASGESVESSDIDIAVLLPPEDLKVSFNNNMLFELETALQNDVDLVFLRSSNTVLQKEVIVVDNMIFCADQNAVDEFEMLVISRYQKLNEEREGIIADAFKTGILIGNE